jgi:hypothetical protein
MTEICTITHEDGITRIQLPRHPIYRDAQRAIDDIAENHPYKKRLWDLRNVDLDFTLNELQNIAEYGKNKFSTPSCVAVIAPDYLVNSEMGVFKIYRGEEHKTATGIFHTESEALEWLADK